ncbi:MAG: Holliday junction branch migration protein RuvA [Gemmatimonadota bacterium]
MICRVRGRLLSREGDRVHVMTDAGIGYEVLVPASLLDRLPAAGEAVDLHTALVARDDALELFGFPGRADRELFLRLQSASGIGPRLALAILGTLSTRRIVQAILARDHSVLQLVSGVGRKTAERLALELADKLDDLPAAEGEEGLEPADDLAALEALRALGYSLVESESALSAARRDLGGREAGAGEIVRAALRHL